MTRCAHVSICASKFSVRKTGPSSTSRVPINLTRGLSFQDAHRTSAPIATHGTSRGQSRTMTSTQLVFTPTPIGQPGRPPTTIPRNVNRAAAGRLPSTRPTLRGCLRSTPAHCRGRHCCCDCHGRGSDCAVNNSGTPLFTPAHGRLHPAHTSSEVYPSHPKSNLNPSSN